MKNLFQRFGVIAFVAVIALSAVGCNNEQNPFPGTWEYKITYTEANNGGTYTATLTFTEDAWTMRNVRAGSSVASQNYDYTYNGSYTVNGMIATLIRSGSGQTWGTAEPSSTGDRIIFSYAPPSSGHTVYTRR